MENYRSVVFVYPPKYFTEKHTNLREPDKEEIEKEYGSVKDILKATITIQDALKVTHDQLERLFSYITFHLMGVDDGPKVFWVDDTLVYLRSNQYPLTDKGDIEFIAFPDGKTTDKLWRISVHGKAFVRDITYVRATTEKEAKAKSLPVIRKEFNGVIQNLTKIEAKPMKTNGRLN